MTSDFLYETEARKGRWRDAVAEDRGLYPAYHWTGEGRYALEVDYATSETQPNITTVRDVWKQRHGRAASPLLVVVAYPRTSPERAVICGPAGESPPTIDVDYQQAERLALSALAEPNRHHAIRFLAGALDRSPDQLPGLRNKGLLATHELEHGVPERGDWSDAVGRSRPLMQLRNHDLVRELGYDIEQRGQHHVLRAQRDGTAHAVAVFLHATEQPDEPSSRHGGQTPVTYALAQAERDNLDWVVAVRGGVIRLYSTSTSGATGQRGRAETFVELNLPLLPSDRAGYLHLLFSAEALTEGGSLHQIQEASADYAAGLSERLRERVYNQVVPRLSVAVAREIRGTSDTDLETHYRTALTILFRLLFIAYGEDSRLLPLHINGDYTRNALKSIARDLAQHINAGEDLGFDNPLTPEVQPATDAVHQDLWDRCHDLFHAVDKGHARWGIPPYNGGLFSPDENANPVGPLIEGLSLSNAEFGPALAALLVDRTPEGDVGPIDFRSLSVREFGTIYEGLLESELSVAPERLTLDSDGKYIPADDEHDAVVDKGEFYLHNMSGARKSTGSYFTKPFAVEHLIDQAVEPTLQRHLERVGELVDEGREADAADLLFDFRVADIAMGSGHFLTAVVDRLEARYSAFLSEHPIPAVTADLDRLRTAARQALGPLAETTEIENSSLLRRFIARRCVYGVDMNPVSVELARVAMWIHTFVPGLPLSFLDHNLVVGNSLTGVGTIEEAARVVDPSAGGGLFTEQVRSQLQAAEEPLRRLANIADATPDDIDKAREASEEARKATEPVQLLFDFVTAHWVEDLPAPVTPDAVATEPHEAKATARAAREELDALHLPVAFPEVFLRDDPGFDVILGNPPWDKVRHEAQQFWVVRSPGLNALPKSRRDEEIERLREERPVDAGVEEAEKKRRERLKTLFKSAYEHQGRYGHLDYAQLFVERAHELTRSSNSAIGYVLPRQFLVLAGWSDLRELLIGRGRLHVAQGRNAGEWIFEDIHQSYMVAFIAARTDGETVELLPAAESPKDLQGQDPFDFGHDDLRSLTDGIAIPWFDDALEVEVFETMRTSSQLEDDSGWVTASHDARWDFRGSGPHRDLAGSDLSVDGWLVFKTRHVRPYQVDTDQKFTQIVENTAELGASGDEKFLGWDVPRVVFRHPSRNDDTRTMIATLLPRSGFIYNKGYVHAADIEEQTPEKALALLGYLNTFVADWWTRRLVDRHVTAAVFNHIRLPDWSEEQVKEAASLVATLLPDDVYDDERETWNVEALRVDPAEARGRLNALALLGFGLGVADTKTMLRDFTNKGVPAAVRTATDSTLEDLQETV